mmetsp:Transcript_9435/g.19974  ORF Transcript_9435/g.19974 Transcript_9435/m.19974 type:complete len:96 (+) Transcript_9435:92-379(+)
MLPFSAISSSITAIFAIFVIFANFAMVEVAQFGGKPEFRGYFLIVVFSGFRSVGSYRFGAVIRWSVIRRNEAHRRRCGVLAVRLWCVMPEMFRLL